MKLDENGIKIDTWQQVFDGRVNDLKSIYGYDIDLSQNTPDGQRVGIESRMIIDLQQFGVYIYNEFDPDLASINGLRRLGKLNGVYPRQETHSTWDIKITTDRSLAIRDNFAIRDNLDQKWIANAQDLSSGENIVTFKADLAGKVGGGSTVRFETSIIGLLSCEPASDVTLGKEGESPVQFRFRRRETIAIAAQSVIGGLISGLYNIEGVTDAKVYENDKPQTDPLTNLPANSIYCVVENGDVSKIAETIAKHKTLGAKTIGEVSGVFVEKLETSAGIYTHAHTMKFDRPTYVNVYVKLKATRQDADEPIDFEQIKQNIGSVIKRIGEDVQAGELYKYSYTDVSNYIVTDLEISRDNATFTDSFLQPAMNERFIFDPANVEVTIV